MEEKVAADDGKATSRRSRKDEEGRDFQCGCGKRYLSYPALYTHIKTKHDGRQPEGTLKTGATQLTKRTKGKFEDELLRSISSLMQREDLRLLSEREGVSGSVSLGARIRKDSLPKEIHECFCVLMKQKEAKLQPTSSLELALVIYLINVGQHVNDKTYDHFLQFARCARNCFAQHGQQIYRSYFCSKDQGGPFILGTFGTNQVRHFPIVSDFLVQCYLQQAEAQFNISLMELITSDFCSWLFKHKLTPIRVSLPSNYTLNFQPAPRPKHTPNKPKPDQTSKDLPMEVDQPQDHEEPSEEGSDNEEVVEVADDEEGEEQKRQKEKDPEELE